MSHSAFELQLLCDSSRVLSQAMLDLDGSLGRLCELLANRLRALVFIALETSDQSALRVVACAHPDSIAHSSLKSRILNREFALQESSGFLNAAYSNTHASAHKHSARINPFNGHTPSPGEIAACSDIRVPLRLQERPLGALLLVREDASAAFSSDELPVLEDLATRIAQAIDQANLYAKESSRRSLLELLTDSLPALVSYVDRNERYVFNNREYERHFELPLSQITGKQMGEVISAARMESIRPHIDRALRGEAVRFEGPMISRDGSPSYFRGTFTPDLDEQGHARGFVVLGEDLTLQRQRELEHERICRQLEEAVRYRDTFLSLASHELRTPLTSLSLQLQLTKRSLARGVAASSLEHHLSIAIEQAARIERLIADLMDLVRVQAGKLSNHYEPVELDSLVRQITSHLGEQLEAAGCPVRTELRYRAPVDCDPCRIEQVLSNLLSNAIKYAPGAPIDISLDGTPESVHLRVRDHGPGIPEGRMHSIFERFERLDPPRKVDGLGLGLYIAREIISSHRGTIRAQKPVQGSGTEFLITLPVQQACARPAPMV